MNVLDKRDSTSSDDWIGRKYDDRSRNRRQDDGCFAFLSAGAVVRSPTQPFAIHGNSDRLGGLAPGLRAHAFSRRIKTSVGTHLHASRSVACAAIAQQKHRGSDEGPFTIQ